MGEPVNTDPKELCVNVIGSSPENTKRQQLFKLGKLHASEFEDELQSQTMQRSKSLKARRSSQGQNQGSGRGKIILRQRSHVNVLMKRATVSSNASPARTFQDDSGPTSPLMTRGIIQGSQSQSNLYASPPKLTTKFHPKQRKIFRSRSAYINPVR